MALVGLALLVSFGVRFDFSSAWQAVLGIPLSNLGLASAAFLLNLIIKAIRWHRMARQLSISVALPVSMAAFFSGCFWGLLTIGRLGEFYRVEALFSAAPSKMVALATCIMDRLIDVAFLAYLAFILSILIFLPWSVADRTALAAGATVVLVLAFVGLSRMTRRRVRTLVPIPTELRRWPRWLEAARERLAPLFVASRDLVFGWRVAETLGLTAASWAAYFLTIHLLALGLGIRTPFAVTCIASSLAAIASALPISFQGIGTREATFVFVFGAVGITTTQAMTLSLSALALFYLVSIPTGGAGVAWRRRQKASNPGVARAATPG